MSVSLQSPPSSAISAFQSTKLGFSSNGSSPSSLLCNLQRSFPRLRASALDTGATTELDAVSNYSEIVPDTVIFDDFERFPPTAATVSSSLLLGICSLPDTIFRNAVDMALADIECNKHENSELRLSCFFNKALVNVGGDLAKLVPGRVSTEVDVRLAYDTHSIIRKVHDLLKLYNKVNVPPERLLFKIPSTWQPGILAKNQPRNDLPTHLVWFVLRVHYIIAPLKVLQSLKDSVTTPEEKYSFIKRLSRESAVAYKFNEEEQLCSSEVCEVQLKKRIEEKKKKIEVVLKSCIHLGQVPSVILL